MTQDQEQEQDATMRELEDDTRRELEARATRARWLAEGYTEPASPGAILRAAGIRTGGA